MARRRMFCIDIVENDIFMDLSLAAQALYFHIGVNCDDYGFCTSTRKIMRFIGADDEHLQELIDGGFIIRFESGVICQRHWYINNRIQSDRTQMTTCEAELDMLEPIDRTTKDNKVYQLKDSKLSKNCPKTVRKLSKEKISKPRIGVSGENLLAETDGKTDGKNDDNPFLR